MLEILKKLKSSVRYYVANYKNDQDSIFTAKEWQLLNHIILLLQPFFSKNNALLSSVKLHARLLTKFVNTLENSEEISNVCKTLAKSIEEAFETRFYISGKQRFGRARSKKLLSLGGRSISS